MACGSSWWILFFLSKVSSESSPHSSPISPDVYTTSAIVHAGCVWQCRHLAAPAHHTTSNLSLLQKRSTSNLDSEWRILAVRGLGGWGVVVVLDTLWVVSSLREREVSNLRAWFVVFPVAIFPVVKIQLREEDNVHYYRTIYLGCSTLVLEIHHSWLSMFSQLQSL